MSPSLRLVLPWPAGDLHYGAGQSGVDHHDLMGGPPVHPHPLTQLVVAGKAFSVMNHRDRVDLRA
jgi:hypothetical protein